MSEIKSIKEKVKFEAPIKSPTTIKIGDPWYFENQSGLKYTYTTNLKSKGFTVGKVVISENELCYDDGFEMDDRQLKVILARNNDMLNLIDNHKMYSHQTAKETLICVDTAQYILSIDGKTFTMLTGGDGSFGTVVEFTTSGRLDAILIDLTLPDDMGVSIDEHKRLIETLFNFKF